MVIDGFIEENGLVPSLKKEIRSPQYGRSPRSLKSSQSLATKHEKKIAPPPPTKKHICGLGGVYNMENKDTNTDYQKFVRVGDQKWEIAEITIGVIVFAWDFAIHYFLYIAYPFDSIS